MHNNNNIIFLFYNSK